MAFGISGSETSSSMLGADVAVAQYDGALQRGLATDYNITALAPVAMACTCVCVCVRACACVCSPWRVAVRAGAGRVARRVPRRPAGRARLQPGVHRAPRRRPHRRVLPPEPAAR